MIIPVEWADSWIERDIGEPDIQSPFQQPRSGPVKRPITLTFDSERLHELPEKESEALATLRITAMLPEVQLLTTSRDDPNHFVIGAYNPKDSYYPITEYSEGRPSSYSGITFTTPQQVKQQAGWLTNPNGYILQSSAVETAAQHLLVALAHRRLRRDILVTTSPYLLQDTRDSQLRSSNPMLPSQAAKVVGLFLRSRDIYVLPRRQNELFRESRPLYFSLMARYKLPAFWRYTTACSEAAKFRKDNIDRLAYSIIKRCARALEARDAIGEFFYMTSNMDNEDRMMYHFEYLHLLLAGAFDAEARITHRIYQLGNRDSERWASFNNWKDENRNKAGKKLGTAEPRLLQAVVEQRTLLGILYNLRKTIVHAENAGPVNQRRIDERKTAIVELPDEVQASLSDTLNDVTVKTRWGFTETANGIGVEPYTYVTHLTDESFQLLNKIAELTHVERLFDDRTTPVLPDSPPVVDADLEYYSERTFRHIQVLG